MINIKLDVRYKDGKIDQANISMDTTDYVKDSADAPRKIYQHLWFCLYHLEQIFEGMPIKLGSKIMNFEDFSKEARDRLDEKCGKRNI